MHRTNGQSDGLGAMLNAAPREGGQHNKIVAVV